MREITIKITVPEGYESISDELVIDDLNLCFPYQIIPENIMKTYNRICTQDYFDYLKRGKEYITSEEKDGTVTVFTSKWISGVPVEIFAGEVVFTE